MGDSFHLKKMAFKAIHKIQDHCGKTIYHVEGQPYVGLLVLRITPFAGEGKVKIVYQNLLLPSGGNIEGDFENREVNKVLTDLQIASWQFLMMASRD